MAFLDPQHNIEQFKLDKGMSVADFGSGSGFYTIEASKAVGSDGRVYSIDVQKDLLERIKKSAIAEQLYNIEVIWGDIEKNGGTKLANYSVDAVILSNTLFQTEDKKELISEIQRVLKPTGKLLLIDWSDSFGNLGPTPAMVFTEKQAEELFISEGFVLERKIEAGDHHYGFVLRKSLVV